LQETKWLGESGRVKSRTSEKKHDMIDSSRVEVEKVYNTGWQECQSRRGKRMKHWWLI